MKNTDSKRYVFTPSEYHLNKHGEIVDYYGNPMPIKPGISQRLVLTIYVIGFLMLAAIVASFIWYQVRFDSARKVDYPVSGYVRKGVEG